MRPDIPPGHPAPAAAPGSPSPYYSASRRLSVASRISLAVRRRMFARFLDVMRPGSDCRVLDLGVTDDRANTESNFFEQWYPYPDRLVCAGVEDASHLEQQHPGVRFQRIEPHRPLPFADGEFDIVFSNAVVEHAGTRAEQAFFLAEALRVSTRFFITTPNRWFPVEMHTALPLLHYLPAPLYRRVLSAIGEDYWAAEEHLNLLDAASFRALFPSSHRVEVTGVRLGGVVSNLIAYGQR
jgi:methyltransferase family protein